ncbi:growth arrest and DNA damage-inducible protein GADD45 alpha-like isoform X1 [Mercenaria mercenaria]|uniref:growth arrest and DNA damage-inducible protein GADD45 alpha-like isoform X1 n=1 Tax=Mercenaria mercenaria TaxID=6596 RepID=UPI001E1E00F0|nr:growth arrest and DNA damage-inducible protein GADD45 alpha-like isoform X1 [Mercenaria mercenaria]
MTLTDLTNSAENNKQEPSVVDIGQVLVEVLKQAVSQGRITLGGFECAEVLETCPEQVMLCILPKVSDSDTMINIQHKLIEAHCWENDVNVVKVDSAEKLVSLLTTPDENSNIDRTRDFSSILIGFPVDEMSSDDYQMTKYSYLFQDSQIDVIPLPD